MTNAPERIRTWKVETTTTGITLTLNGKAYTCEFGESLAFEIDRCARGLNPPSVTREVE